MRKRPRRHESRPSPTQIEAKLLEGLNGEPIPITRGYFERKKRALVTRFTATERSE